MQVQLSSGIPRFTIVGLPDKAVAESRDLGDPALACSRASRCAADYQARVSGPFLDRIDLHVEVPGVSAAGLTLPPPAEGTAEIARRVAAARQVQSDRYNGRGGTDQCGG